MMEKDLLKKAIDQVYEYLEDEGSREISWTDFVAFLNARSNGSSMNSAENPVQSEVAYNTKADDLGISLVLLNRYAHSYIKEVLKDGVLNTPDEFSFLITLLVAGSHTKSELISRMLLTKTSGTEVIKRLLEKDLLKEYDDPHDKRSKRVELTDKGKKAVLELLPKMNAVSEVVRGNLSEQELSTLNYLLKKLERHHKNNHNVLMKEKIEPLSQS